MSAHHNLRGEQFASVFGQLFTPGTEPGGFSVHAETGEVPSSGYMVSQAGTERVIPNPLIHPEHLADYVAEHREALHPRDRFFGGWNEKRVSQVALDVSQNIRGSGPLAESQAVLEGARHGQKAIYDLNRGEEIANPFHGMQYPEEVHAEVNRRYQEASKEYR